MNNFLTNRKAFSNTMIELAKADPTIVVICSDARNSVTLDAYARLFPKQFIEVGIAEQNEIGIAAGMATFGKKVFVCAPACFLSTRALEQVKVDIVYSQHPVRIIGISGGVSYGALGFSHQSLHDFAVMRTFPDLAVLAPADRFQTEAMTRWMATGDKAVYLRMGRSPVADVYHSVDESFQFGKANMLHDGTDGTIIVTGELVSQALEAARLLKDEGYSVRVLNIHTIKPLDTDCILAAACETGALLTLEEHSIYGGLGSAIAEVISQQHPVPMRIMGIPDEIPVEGPSTAILEHYGLTSSGVCTAMKQLLLLRI